MMMMQVCQYSLVERAGPSPAANTFGSVLVVDLLTQPPPPPRSGIAGKSDSQETFQQLSGGGSKD